MSTYADLGIRSVINAYATLTRLGGSLMPPEVVSAMNAAAQSFVDLPELQRQAGDHVARLTKNEAAYISSGAAAGLVLATAACVTRQDASLVRRFPDLTGLKHEVIVHATHRKRNGYDYAVQQTGVTFVEIGDENGTTAAQLEAAITPATAAFFWFQGVMTTPHDLPLPEVIRIAHAHDIPVIVDAAAQLPPVSNLWGFTQMGVDIAIFSGGKDLCGPQASGLMVGRRDLIEACRMHGNPNQAIGRPMKVGKEEIMGLVAAVERYLTLDHAARERYCEETVQQWCDTLNQIEGITAVRSFPNEAGQPLPRCYVGVDAKRWSRDEIVQQLADGEPSIVVESTTDGGLYINPMTLQAGEEQIILARLQEILC